MPGEVFDEKNASDALYFYGMLRSTGFFEGDDTLAEITAGMALASDDRPEVHATDNLVAEGGEIVEKLIDDITRE